MIEPSPRRASDTGSEPIVRVEDLEVTFRSKRLLGGSDPAVRAVDGVSLEIHREEVFCIAGESGSGKTTLGRAMLGLVKGDSGTMEVAGDDPGRLGPRSLRAFRRRAQMIYQDPMGALNPRQTVYEAVAEPVRIHHLAGNEEELVARALGRVGLRPPERFFLSYPHELSGGQRQRVVIASAIVLEPHIIVADEPVSMLDASVRGEILKLLVDLKNEMGMTLVLITHDLGFAWALADRVAVMYLGKIVELGPAVEVLTKPLHPYTRALLSVSPEVGERRTGQQILTGEPPDPARIPPGCRFHPRCPEFNGGRARDDRHRSEIPELRELRREHYVACHIAESLVQDLLSVTRDA